MIMKNEFIPKLKNKARGCLEFFAIALVLPQTKIEYKTRIYLGEIEEGKLRLNKY
jgi:hypothetical protein